MIPILFLAQMTLYIIIVALRDVNMILCNCSSFHIIIFEFNLISGTWNMKDDNDNVKCATGMARADSEAYAESAYIYIEPYATNQ